MRMSHYLLKFGWLTVITPECQMHKLCVGLRLKQKYGSALFCQNSKAVLTHACSCCHV